MISSDYWYKNAIIYTMDVERFADGNGDGIGDFQGLTSRLDYLAGLGITCLWLLPFYPSPERDEGYDVSDYYGVNPHYGTLGNFVEFMREARERGIRVIIDLVVNHTSDQHPWFQAARSDPNSPYREYYVWDDDPEHHGEPVFPGEEDRIWTYDEKAGAYYLHHFYRFQPDLNVDNPTVREEILRVMGFWLELGVSGFRVDAAPFLIEDTTLRAARGGGEGPRYEFLSEMRELLEHRKGDAVLLAEANVPLDRLPKYFENGERFHLLFDFILNQHLFLAMARQEAAPLAEALRGVPKMPWRCQWTNFIRNHDELTLDQLTEKERAESLRGVRARGAHADLRARHPTAGAADVRRGLASSEARVQPADDTPRHAHRPLRRGDRDGRRPVAAGADQRTHGHAVDVGTQWGFFVGAAGPNAGPADPRWPLRL